MGKKLNVVNTLKIDPTDTEIIIGMDKSGSMSWGSGPNQTGKARWPLGEETLTALATEVEKFDDDGLTVFLFDNGYKIEDGVTSGLVAKLFKDNTPGGGTTLSPPIAALVNKFIPAPAKSIWGKYKTQAVPVKPVVFIIFTDGCPSDKNEVAATIIDATKRTAQGNVGFLFVQVGHDEEAETFLKWLDENLKGAAYDAVSRVRIEDVEDYTAQELVIMAICGANNS